MMHSVVSQSTLFKVICHTHTHTAAASERWEEGRRGEARLAHLSARLANRLSGNGTDHFAVVDFGVHHEGIDACE